MAPPRGLLPVSNAASSAVGSRIVHVGTHALTEGSGSTLWSCLRQHRGNVNPPGGSHRASQLRKIVGEAIMAKKPDLAVVSWGRGEQGPSRGNRSEAILERLVSRRIRGMSVVCLPVEDAPGPDSLRAFIARNAIALLSGFVEAASDPPSPHWLGRHSPRERVRRCGLWNEGDVNAEVDSRFLEVFGDQVLDTRSLASRPTTHYRTGPGLRKAGSRDAVRGIEQFVEHDVRSGESLRTRLRDGSAGKRIQCTSLHGHLKCGAHV